MENTTPLVYLYITIMLTTVLLAVIWWRILSKAGYPGFLGLLIFVPVLNLFLMILLAFRKWPLEKEIANLKDKNS